MSQIEKTIDVDVPVRMAYDQWTQFEEFPRFMSHVEEVRQLDDKRLHWRASIAGQEKTWNAEIVKQVPNQIIAWRSTSGSENAGTVSFQPLGADRTKVTLNLSYEPEGVAERVGDAVGIAAGSIEGDLRRFKEFIESRTVETGAWRGEIKGGKVT